MIAALQGRAIRLYGDGKQVRDLLYIDDLLDLYERGWRPGDQRVYVSDVTKARRVHRRAPAAPRQQPYPRGAAEVASS